MHFQLGDVTARPLLSLRGHSCGGRVGQATLAHSHAVARRGFVHCADWSSIDDGVAVSGNCSCLPGDGECLARG